MTLTRAFVQTEGKDTLMKTCKRFASFPTEDSAGIRPSQEPVTHILGKYCLGNKPLMVMSCRAGKGLLTNTSHTLSGKQLNQTRQSRKVCDQPHAVTNMFETCELEGQPETRPPFPPLWDKTTTRYGEVASVTAPLVQPPRHPRELLPTTTGCSPCVSPYTGVGDLQRGLALPLV